MRCSTCATSIMVEGPETRCRDHPRDGRAGTNGILVPPDGYLAGVRAICDEFGIVMIADEVMAGFGRCGEWFAVDQWGVTPDLITFAKGVNSGYVPLGGVIISDDDRRDLREAGLSRRPDLFGPPAGLRRRPSPRSTSSRRRASSSTPATSATTRSGPGLEDSPPSTPPSARSAGLGVFWALELVRDRATREPLVPFNAAGAEALPMSEFAASCKESGCGRSRTSTGLMSCRRARLRRRMFKRVWTSSTAHLKSPIATTRESRRGAVTGHDALGPRDRAQ